MPPVRWPWFLVIKSASIYNLSVTPLVLQAYRSVALLDQYNMLRVRCLIEEAALYVAKPV